MKNLDSKVEYTVSVNRWGLRLLGVWPIPDRFSNTRFAAIYLLIMSAVLPQSTDLLQNAGFGDDTIDNLSSLTPCVLVLVKLAIVRMNIRKLRECWDSVVEDWSHRDLLRTECIDLMVRNSKTGRRLLIACIVLLYVTALGYLTLPFTIPKEPTFSFNTTSIRRLPLNAIYPFNVYKDPIFEIVYIFQCLSIVAGATANFSIDNFLALLVLHYCGQLEILGGFLEKYKEQVEHGRTKRHHFGCSESMGCITERYLHIMRSAKDIEDTFNIILLVQLLLNSILFCFLGYRIIVNFEDSNAIGIMTFVIFIFTMMFHLFIHCYVGEQLMEKSRAVSSSAYRAEWYNLQPNTARALILLMAQCGRPLKITAGKFIVMSLESYTDILRTSATYLSVLRAVQE